MLFATCHLISLEKLTYDESWTYLDQHWGRFEVLV